MQFAATDQQSYGGTPSGYNTSVHQACDESAAHYVSMDRLQQRPEVAMGPPDRTHRMDAPEASGAAHEQAEAYQPLVERVLHHAKLVQNGLRKLQRDSQPSTRLSGFDGGQEHLYGSEPHEMYPPEPAAASAATYTQMYRELDSIVASVKRSARTSPSRGLASFALPSSASVSRFDKLCDAVTTALHCHWQQDLSSLQRQIPVPLSFHHKRPRIDQPAHSGALLTHKNKQSIDALRREAESLAELVATYTDNQAQHFDELGKKREATANLFEMFSLTGVGRELAPVSETIAGRSAAINDIMQLMELKLVEFSEYKPAASALVTALAGMGGRRETEFISERCLEEIDSILQPAMQHFRKMRSVCDEVQSHLADLYEQVVHPSTDSDMQTAALSSAPFMQHSEFSGPSMNGSNDLHEWILPEQELQRMGKTIEKRKEANICALLSVPDAATVCDLVRNKAKQHIIDGYSFDKKLFKSNAVWVHNLALAESPNYLEALLRRARSDGVSNHLRDTSRYILLKQDASNHTLQAQEDMTKFLNKALWRIKEAPYLDGFYKIGLTLIWKQIQPHLDDLRTIYREHGAKMQRELPTVNPVILDATKVTEILKEWNAFVAQLQHLKGVNDLNYKGINDWNNPALDTNDECTAGLCEKLYKLLAGERNIEEKQYNSAFRRHSEELFDNIIKKIAKLDQTLSENPTIRTIIKDINDRTSSVPPPQLVDKGSREDIVCKNCFEYICTAKSLKSPGDGFWAVPNNNPSPDSSNGVNLYKDNFADRYDQFQKTHTEYKTAYDLLVGWINAIPKLFGSGDVLPSADENQTQNEMYKRQLDELYSKCCQGYQVLDLAEMLREYVRHIWFSYCHGDTHWSPSIRDEIDFVRPALLPEVRRSKQTQNKTLSDLADEMGYIHNVCLQTAQPVPDVFIDLEKKFERDEDIELAQGKLSPIGYDDISSAAKEAYWILTNIVTLRKAFSVQDFEENIYCFVHRSKLNETETTHYKALDAAMEFAFAGKAGVATTLDKALREEAKNIRAKFQEKQTAVPEALNEEHVAHYTVLQVLPMMCMVTLQQLWQTHEFFTNAKAKDVFKNGNSNPDAEYVKAVDATFDDMQLKDVLPAVMDACLYMIQFKGEIVTVIQESDHARDLMSKHTKQSATRMDAIRDWAKRTLQRMGTFSCLPSKVKDVVRRILIEHECPPVPNFADAVLPLFDPGGMVRSAEEQMYITTLAQQVLTDLMDKHPHLRHPGMSLDLIYDEKRNDFFNDFVQLVNAHEQLTRRFAGTRVTYARDAKTVANYYRAKCFAFAHAQVLLVESETDKGVSQMFLLDKRANHRQRRVGKQQFDCHTCEIVVRGTLTASLRNALRQRQDERNAEEKRTKLMQKLASETQELAARNKLLKEEAINAVQTATAADENDINKFLEKYFTKEHARDMRAVFTMGYHNEQFKNLCLAELKAEAVLCDTKVKLNEMQTQSSNLNKLTRGRTLTEGERNLLRGQVELMEKSLKEIQDQEDVLLNWLKGGGKRATDGATVKNREAKKKLVTHLQEQIALLKLKLENNW